MKIEKLIEAQNIADDLDEYELSGIGNRVVEEYESDLDSRKEWELLYDDAMKIARQIKEDKSFPWAKASNIKYPLIASASIQFAARAYPELVKDGKIAGCKIVGRDPDDSKQARADRISIFLNYQLSDQIEFWNEDTDRLLHVLPIAGFCWRKTYFNPINGPQSDFLLPKDVVVHYWTKSLKSAPRITHVFPLYPNEIVERKRSGLFLDIDLGIATSTEEYDATDHDKPHIFLEQHRWWDLDDDGYQEPYIVTVHKESKKVMRIVARYTMEDVIVDQKKQVVQIKPCQYFTKYSFIPAPDGSFYDIGFGVLLNPLNDSINTMFNQLIDSGTLSNAGGGFIGKGARMQGGPIRFRPGEWKPIDVQGGILRDAIVPIPPSGPSQTLFNLLTLLIETSKELSSVSNEMSGQQTSPNEPATSMMARLEQGMKVFTSIHKRIYRALTDELKKIYELDRKYLTQEMYQNIVDEQCDVKADFEDKSVNVLPIADPNMSSDVQRMIRAKAVLEIVTHIPGANLVEAGRDALTSLRVSDIDKILPEPDPNAQPKPSPEEQQAQQKMQLAAQDSQVKQQNDAQRLQIEQQRFQMDAERNKMEMDKLEAEFNLKIKDMSDRLALDEKRIELELNHKQDVANLNHKQVMDLKKLELGLPDSEAEDKMDETLQEIIQQGQATNEALQQMALALSKILEQQQAPRGIVRDASGRAVAVSVGNEVRPVIRDEQGQIVGLH